MSANMTTVAALLKEFYLPAVRNQLNNTVFLLSQVEQGSEDVEGLEAVLSLQVRRSAGIGSRADGGTLPTAGRQGYVKARVPLKYHYGRIQVSGPLMAAGATDSGSFARPLQAEMDGIVTDLKNDINRQIFGTSNGVIAATVTSTTTTTINMAASFSRVQQDQITEGMTIDVGTVANPVAVASGLTVASVTSTTVVVDTTSISTDSTHRIFRSGNGGSGASQKEVTGLQSIVNSGDELFSVSGTTYSAWNSYVDSNGGTNRPVSENLLTKAQHEVGRRSGLEADLWITSDGVHRNVANLLTSTKRFPNTVELKAGYSGLDVSAAGQGRSGGAPVAMVWDKDAPSNKAFLVNTSKVKWHKAGDWDYLDQDGSVLSRVANGDGYEATLKCYSEFATDFRAAHGLVSDLSES